MGSLFSNTVKSGVAQPGGPTNYYSNPAEATQSLATASMRTAQPTTSAVNGTISDDPNAPSPTVSTVTPNALPQPTLVHPTGTQAADNPSLYTRKGTILSMLLNAGLGAGAGYAAASVGNPRTGYAGPGAGFEAGMQLPFQLQQQRNAAAAQQQEQQLRQAQIAALPGQTSAENALKAAQTAAFDAQADRREHWVIPGVGLIDESGKVLAAEPAKRDTGDRVNTLNEFTQQFPDIKLTDQEKKAYILDAKPADGMFQLLSLAAQSTNKDPAISGPARATINAYRGIKFYGPRAKAAQQPGEISASQQRALAADPQLHALNQTLNLTVAEQQKVAEGVSMTAYQNPGEIQPTIDDLTNRISARQAELLKQNSGALSLQGKAKGAAAGAAANPLVGQTKYLKNGKKVKITGVDGQGNATVVPVN